jgi:hypothetical protein
MAMIARIAADPGVPQTRRGRGLRRELIDVGDASPHGCAVDPQIPLTRGPTEADNLTMSEAVTELTVTRWKRYGKDRLYLTDADETEVGWWDLVTDEGHPESPEHASALLAAVARWRVAQDAPLQGCAPVGPDPVAPVAPVVASGPAPAKPEGPSLPTEVPPAVEPVVLVAPSAAIEPTPDADPTPAPADDAPAARPWIDLTTNRAGAEAREQALAAREAAPVKTLLARALGVHTDERAWRIGADGE